QGGAGWPPIPP
uniref:Bradykinin-potentiating peptide 11 n=1 Tax=Bothrops jararaca TaxID=8724 RepID=BPP11_BOTJA|nr:RecName: Full=Bradykinin-potentiating peptide 11; Short=BPP-11 [Bothrops jararaca]